MTTILQISDPHLLSHRDGRFKGVPTAGTLAAVLEQACERYPDCDRVIWTGDLSQEHTEEGYRLLAELMGDWTARSLLIPGNHDDRAALLGVFPHPASNDQCVTFQAELGDWQLIGLDSHVPGEVAGRLSEEQLEQLHFWLAENPQRPTLLFIHHPPVSVETPWLDSIGLSNPEPLEMLIARNPGVQAIFCGHVHHEYEGSLGGIPVFTAPSTAFQFQGGAGDVSFQMISPGFRAITLEDDQCNSEVVRLATLEHPPRDD